MFSVTKHYKFWFIFSAVLTLGSLALLAVWGLKPGIDFRGGTLSQIEFSNSQAVATIQTRLDSAGIKNATIQPLSDKQFLIKTPALSPDETTNYKNTLGKIGDYKEQSFESIGPTIGRELVTKSYWQIILVCFGIIFYIAYSFRKISSSAKNS